MNQITLEVRGKLLKDLFSCGCSSRSASWAKIQQIIVVCIKDPIIFVAAGLVSTNSTRIFSAIIRITWRHLFVVAINFAIRWQAQTASMLIKTVIRTIGWHHKKSDAQQMFNPEWSTCAELGITNFATIFQLEGSLTYSYSMFYYLHVTMFYLFWKIKTFSHR